MRQLLIVHALSWCDKSRAAEEPIKRLIASRAFDRIIELAPSRPDVLQSRYLEHDGDLLEHETLGPIPFLHERFFGSDALCPVADVTVLVGGVLNPGGGGCLSVTFAHLVQYLWNSGRPATVTVPVSATYNAEAGNAWARASAVDDVGAALHRSALYTVPADRLVYDDGAERPLDRRKLEFRILASG